MNQTTSILCRTFMTLSWLLLIASSLVGIWIFQAVPEASLLVKLVYQGF